jgi:signal-transduction protein with cAMP-binding, CBS, and nucleotidyltransferase domain
MKDKAQDITVDEVMSRSPKTIWPEMTAQEAGKLMRQEDVGSLIVIEDGAAVGILTEKDLVEKVVAEGKLPAKVKVMNIMSSPLVTIEPGMSVAEAARKMSEMKMRRLPVVHKGKLIGILTENDVLKLSPSLIEITREWSRLGVCGPSPGTVHQITSGYCENCGAYYNELMMREGELLCADCYDQLRPMEEAE